MSEEFKWQTYLQDLSESIDQMVDNAVDFANFQKEQKLWDCTLAEGLPGHASGLDPTGG